MNLGFGVELRRIEESDLENLRTARNDPAIWSWCRQNDLISQEDQRAWFHRQNNDPSVRMYAIFYGDAWAGVGGLTSIDAVHRRAEFSLYIKPGLHGRGLGRKALRSLLKHGFMNLGLNVIWGETFEGNPAMKMFLSLGMKHEGTRQKFYFKGGKFIDAHLISVTREQWESWL